jgi:RND family efflux transporter MFP subunit
MSRRSNVLVFAGMAIALLLGGGAVASQRLAPERVRADSPREPAPESQPPPPEPPPRRSYRGVLVARTVEACSRTSGRVQTVRYAVGQRVKRGAILVRMDDRAARHELASAQATLGAARDRQRRRGAVARVQGDDVALASAEDVTTSRYETRAAEARVGQLRAQLEDSIVRAPFDGVIANRFVEPGAYVHPGAPLLRVLGADGLRVRFAVPVEEAGAVTVGERVLVASDDASERAHATVENIAPEIEGASGLVVVEAVLSRDVAGLTVGRAVSVSRL